MKQPAQNYAKLTDTIKTASAWWHYFESTWLIETEESPKQWFKKLEPALNEMDRILVIEIKAHYWGYLPEKAWPWLHTRLKD